MLTKKNLYLAAMVFMTVVAVASCEKPETENGNEETPEVTEKTPLASPVLSVSEQTPTSFTIVWEPVDNALSYTYVLDSGEEQPTSQCNASFTDLVPTSEHSVKVKACPASDSEEWSDSEWAIIEVKLEMANDWFVVNGPYLFDESTGLHRYDMIGFDVTGRDIASARFGVFEPTEIEGLDLEDMSGDELTEMLPYSFSDNILLTLNNAGAMNNLSISGLEPETTYLMVFYVENRNGGSMVLVTGTVTTDKEPEMPDELAQWLGTYEVTSSSQLKIDLNEDNTVSMTVVDEPKEFDMTIEYFDPSMLYVYGWSVYDPTRQDMARLTEDGGLAMLSQVQFSDNMIWLPVVRTEDDGAFSVATGCEYLFTFYDEGGSIRTEPFSSNLINGGSAFTVFAADLFGITGGGVGLKYTEYPVYLPGGEFTVVKTGSSAPRRFAVQNVAGPSGSVVPASEIRTMSVVVR